MCFPRTRYIGKGGKDRYVMLSALSRSGFHAWLTRPPSARARSDEVLGARVRDSFVRSDRTYRRSPIQRHAAPQAEKPMISVPQTSVSNRQAPQVQRI
jgi:hypothetical protein